MLTKEQLLASLKLNTLEVSFEKADGSNRKMICTLDESIVPDSPDKENKLLNLNESQIRVWDIEANAWRSFRYDSIKHILVAN